MVNIKAYLCSKKNAPYSIENFHKLLHLAIELTSKTTCFDTLDDIVISHLPHAEWTTTGLHSRSIGLLCSNQEWNTSTLTTVREHFIHPHLLSH